MVASRRCPLPGGGAKSTKIRSTLRSVPRGPLEGPRAPLEPRPVDFGGVLGPPGGTLGRLGGPKKAISAKKPCARSVFFSDFRGIHAVSNKTWKSSFYFSESTIFRGPGVPKVVPGGSPGGPKWCPGAPETGNYEKCRPSYISACLLLPLPPSLSLRPRILGFFGGSLGPPGDFTIPFGDPKIIKKSSKIHPRAPSGPL